MKNFFRRFKSYSFWLTFSGACVLIANSLGNAFGFHIQNKVIEDCIMGVAEALVLLGVVTMDSGNKNDENGGDETNDK